MATPVEIVRPEHSLRTSLVIVASTIAGIFFRAWIVMLLVPVVWRPVSYFWALALVLIVAHLMPDNAYYRLWTRSAVRR